MTLNGKSILVTGGSRGLGLGVVEALLSEGAEVTVVARDKSTLESLAKCRGVAVIPADITDQRAAARILGAVNPDILILNAGAVPIMGPIDKMSWSDFSVAWETDVKAGLFWMQAALNRPLAPGSRVLVSSSGAAAAGSPLSGGYAGAKRMLWFMADYANKLAREKSLGVTFQAIVLQRMIGGTSVGDAGVGGYSKKAGVNSAVFLSSFGTSMSPRIYGDHVVAILKDERYANALALGLKSDTGISILQEAAA